MLCFIIKTQRRESTPKYKEIEVIKNEKTENDN